MFHLGQFIGGLKMSREKEYKVDSTKGNSLINPLNYKGDVLVQVWVDSRLLATLCRWMDGKGTYPRFLSHVVKRPLEVLTGFLVDNGEVEIVDDTAAARRMLESRFGLELNKGGRGGKNVLHNLTLSDRRGELGEKIREEKKGTDAYSQRRIKSPLLDRAMEVYENLQGVQGNSIIGELSALKERDSSPEEIAEHIKRADEEENKKLDELANVDIDVLMKDAVRDK